MRDRQLKKRLEALEVPAYDVQKMEETIINARHRNGYKKKTRMTNLEFVFDQFRFIRKRTWIAKGFFSLFLLHLLLTNRVDSNSWFWTFIAISGPVLCLMSANEICAIFQPGMLELQMTAKHSFHKVLLIRLMAFGGFDCVLFSGMAVILSVCKGITIWQIIVYGMVPYEIMCLGCIFILNRCREENLLLYCGTWGICFSCMIVLLKISGTAIFETDSLPVWIETGMGALIVISIELCRLWKKTGGNQNEIGYGTVIETI